ncbi:MAG: glycosyltransferase [Phenylobacterium sp.]|uniref:glycosyltransferase n=1 Tax=Phenylobacterium sp. TaxID=1871053 RepID=UPI001A36D7E2|nr:glycosyltransferase [Phenylobacterium sp.]MBL8773443.1 glycosyltransferase [Phenylobacterium sp.]
MRIFYVTQGVHRTGGQLVNLDHVAALRRFGYDARLLFVRPEGEPPGAFAPEFPAGFDAPWSVGAPSLAADDIAVVGEMFGAGALAVMDAPCRKILHNQGPYYSFSAFLDVPSIERWGAEAMILPSGFAADMLRRMGWTRPLHVVRPALDPGFASAGGPRRLRIAATVNRRPQEWRLIRGAFRSLRPDLGEVPWIEIRDMSRAQVAQAMAGSELFLALGEREGLGLPPLEALATGALVVGFTGGGGREYATPENGDWFDEGAYIEIAETLARRVDELRAGETFEARRAAGRAAAAGFSREAFEAQLAAAWASIAGEP